MIVAARQNVGFGAANNVALRRVSAPLVLLLNSDTIVPAGAIDTLLARLEATRRGRGRAASSWTARAGPRSRSGRCCRRGRVRVSAGASGWRGRRRTWHAAHRTAARRRAVVDWVSGACLLASRADARGRRFFDERFFMYEEDVDFCAALRARGGRVLFTPAREVTHLRGRSVDRTAGRRRARRTTIAATSRSTRSTLRDGRRGCGSGSGSAAGRFDRISAEPARLRIAIDARKLHDYGIGTYVRNLLRELARQDDDDEYVLLCRPDGRRVAPRARAAVPPDGRSGRATTPFANS